MNISKDDLKIETIGWIDSSCAQIGLLKSYIKDENKIEILEKIQKKLYSAASEIMIKESSVILLENRIKKKDVKDIEQLIIKTENKIAKDNWNVKNGFKIPGGTIPSALTDVARTTVRTMERRLVALKKQEDIINDNIFYYVNKISDYLFLFSYLV